MVDGRELESMTHQLRERLRALTKEHPLLNQRRNNTSVARVDAMADYYAAKADDEILKDAPSYYIIGLFRGYASALRYAKTHMKKYDRLTKQVHELVEETDENRTDSKG